MFLLHVHSEHLKNSAVATGLEKLSFHSNPKERQCHRMFKLQYNCIIFHAGNEMLKILQTRLQQYMNWELIDVRFRKGFSEFRKGRGTRDQIASICWIIEKTRVPEKHLLYWLHQSLWLCGSKQTVENSLRVGNTRPPDLPLEKPVCISGSNS